MINPSLKSQRRAKCKMWKKRQLFRATDFESLMYPCFAFCRILGIFPYKINASTFEISIRYYILSTVIICILIICGLVTLYEIDIVRTMFGNMPKILERNCFYILGCFTAVVNYILSAPRMHLLQSIMNISSRVSPDSYRKLSRLIHAKDTFGFFYLVGQGMLHYFTRNVYNLHMFFTLYVILVTFQMDMLHMNCVCVLKACFKEVNDNLTNLRELVVNDKPHLLRRIYHEHRNPFLLMELKALKKQHLAISEIVQILNMIFSPHLFTTIVITFAEITFILYFFILHWKSGLDNMNDLVFDASLTMSLTYYCIKITLIGWACDTGRDQATRIGITIHEILNNVVDKQIRDVVNKKNNKIKLINFICTFL